MLRRFALALPALVLLPTAALACDETETFLYTCATDQPERSLSLCATEEDSGDGMHYTGVRFVYQTEKGDEISYPANPAEGQQKLFFSHQFKDKLYQASVRFEMDGATYRLSYHDAPADAPQGPTGGLEVMKDGKTIQTIDCSEQPSFYFDQARSLLSCDETGPFGKAGCAGTPPEAP